MSYSYDVTRTIEMTSMQGAYEKVEKDFILPHISKKITYNTPNGTFSVSLNVTDKHQYEITLLTQEQMGKYQAGCGHQHDWKILSGQKAMADFCKSSMRLKFEAGFHDDVLKDKLMQLMKRHNESCSPGVTSLPPTIGQQYFGLIDDKGVMRQFRAFVVSGKDANMQVHQELNK